MGMISPNDMHQAAIDMMLPTKEIRDEYEWMLIVNFWALNVKTGMELSSCKIMKLLYDCPLDDDTIDQIAMHQQRLKEKEAA